MAINATNNGTKRELIPAGNYIARCYQMIEIGTVKTTFQGVDKMVPKVRIGWELPEELKIFNPEKGEQPLVISKEFTLFMNEKSNLRKTLASWRGKDFTEEQAKSFDITVLIGKPCFLNIIHKPSKTDPTKIYEEIGSVSPLTKSTVCPPQINPDFILSYDSFDEALFNSLPDFIKVAMAGSEEYQKMAHPEHSGIPQNSITDSINAGDDDLPF